MGVCNKQELNFRYLVALLVDPNEGTLEGLCPDVGMFPNAFKLNKGTDPDLPTWNQAMCSPKREQCEAAAVTKVEELTKHKTWTLWKRSDLPPNTKVLPTTWVF